MKDFKIEISAVEAARRLKVGLNHIYAQLWTGKLAGRKVGHVWKVPLTEVEQRIKERLKGE